MKIRERQQDREKVSGKIRNLKIKEDKVELEVSGSTGGLEMKLFSEILALPASLQLIAGQIAADSLSLVFTIVSTSSRAYCPLCQMPSRRIHSHYGRTLTDLNWGIYRVSWHLWVRKFFCSNSACPRKIFTERLGTLVKPYARKTERLLTRIQAIVLALGGKAGERLSKHLDYPISRQALLLWVSRLPLREIKDVKVIGVDDWAYRKGKAMERSW